VESVGARALVLVVLLAPLASAALSAAEPVVVITTEVYDVEFYVGTPFGSPMEGATVLVRKLDGSVAEASVGVGGLALVEEVPKGALEVKIESWRGLPVDSRWYEVSAEQTSVIVEEIGLLKVRVVGARGQGLAGAEVAVEGTPVSGATAADGIFSAELPEGAYRIEVNYGGRSSEAEVEVTGGEVTEIEISLPVFAEIAGWAMSPAEFAGLVVLLVALAIVIVVGLYEYAVWRRRRIAAALIPVKK